MLTIGYDEEADEVVLQIESGETTVEHRMHPQQLSNLEERVQRMMKKTAVISEEELIERKNARS